MEYSFVCSTSVTQLQLQTAECKPLFKSFDSYIKNKLKCKDHTYNGAKLHPEDWADLLEFNSDFNNNFNKIYDNINIQEAGDYTPEVLEDTYLNMELAVARDCDGPKFAYSCEKIQRCECITNSNGQ